METQRVYVSVSGGVVDEVDVPRHTDGTYKVIDWDSIEQDPGHAWNRFDEADRAYIREHYPEDFGKFFGKFK